MQAALRGALQRHLERYPKRFTAVKVGPVMGTDPTHRAQVDLA